VPLFPVTRLQSWSALGLFPVVLHAHPVPVRLLAPSCRELEQGGGSGEHLTFAATRGFNTNQREPGFLRMSVSKGDEGRGTENIVGLSRGEETEGCEGEGENEPGSRHYSHQRADRDRVADASGGLDQQLDASGQQVGVARARRPLFAGGAGAEGEDEESAGEGSNRDLSGGAGVEEEGEASTGVEREVGAGDGTSGFAAAAAAAVGGRGEGAYIEAFERKYPGHGQGLVERLMALEDAGIRCGSVRVVVVVHVALVYNVCAHVCVCV